jgi:hypothetical protein
LRLKPKTPPRALARLVLCPLCAGLMRIITFITHSADIRQALARIGVESELSHIAPTREPPLWDDCDAQSDEALQVEPDWGLAAQQTPDYEVDQRVNWCVLETAIFMPSGFAMVRPQPLKLIRPKASGYLRPAPYLATCH